MQNDSPKVKNRPLVILSEAKNLRACLPDLSWVAIFWSLDLAEGGTGSISDGMI
jgi:hypothetical protein